MAKRFGWLAILAIGCATPTQLGKPVDPADFARAEERCRDQALARYGRGMAPKPGAGDRCDAQSWLCRKTENWMLSEGNSLSTAEPRERLVHQATRKCLEARGYRVP